ncbi:DUF3037 domain-containing protein [Stenotrophomonas maltophilia]|uniref:DUF3037 domain-containing protein n=1 Tax=Stenotrophomonas maltophilia TaxID=40324 RepID=UPI00209B0C67|nr:DUF3037 domain-containing protein [Stenotrophomonas maltophilia]MCO7487054.1 DUF3037 domain-containing protein [Stenotrophomonas maltophilia]
MNERIKYSYITLRYVHDAVSREFVNVGVVLFAESSYFLSGKMRKRYGRINSFFPDAQGAALARALRAIERGIKRIGVEMHAKRRLPVLPHAEGGADILSIVRSVLPLDDSALQWGEIMHGMTYDLQGALERHFDRIVCRYDEPVERHSRSDYDIWKEFSRVLVDRRLEQKVTSHAIRSPLDVVEFDKAIKNGKWHVLEPVSFDLLDGATIKRKAHQLIGQMSILEDSKEDFDLYLLIGEPKSPDVQKDFQVALKMLDTIRIPTKVFTESRVSDFGRAIEIAMQD